MSKLSGIKIPKRKADDSSRSEYRCEALMMQSLTEAASYAQPSSAEFQRRVRHSMDTDDIVLPIDFKPSLASLFRGRCFFLERTYSPNRGEQDPLYDQAEYLIKVCTITSHSVTAHSSRYTAAGSAITRQASMSIPSWSSRNSDPSGIPMQFTTASTACPVSHTTRANAGNIPDRGVGSVS